MTAIADTLGVSRSNLIERPSRAPRRRPYRKPEDAALLPLIRRLVDERPTYGYRRLTALLNRQLRTEGKPTVNGKRVLRILQVNGQPWSVTPESVSDVPTMVLSWRCARTCAGVPITSNCTAVTARSCGSCLPSTPVTGRSSPGRPRPPASPARSCET